MNERIVRFIKYHPVRAQRGLEIVTGLVPWSIILFLLAGSFVLPEAVAFAVILFNVYWLYRSLTMAINAFSGYLNIRAAEKTDWQKKLRTDSRTKNRWQKIRQVVIICNFKEPLPILRRTLDAISAQNFPRKQIVVVLAMEEREPESREKARILIREYRRRLGRLMATYHPLTPGETIGKHSNEAYAARQAKKTLVDKEGVPVNNIIITTADADSVLPGQYFSLLTYRFLTVPEPEKKFFQAPQFPFNNISQVPLLVRIMEIPSGISQLSGLKKFTKRYFVVSTYSVSLVLLEKIGYWDPDFIPEDWHINIKAYFALRGEVEVVPLFLVVSIDAAQSETSWKTYKNRYQQVKRQAWGAVDVPYALKQFFLHPEIPLGDKINKVSFILESHFLWSVNWFFLTIGANIPIFLNPVFARTGLGFNISRVSAFILTGCLFGMLAIIFVHTMLNPKEEKKIAAFLHPLTYLQWLFLPVAGLFLNALPGLESQTRLMLGKYLEYRVTEKKA